MRSRTDERKQLARKRERRRWARRFVAGVAADCGGRPGETLELLEWLLAGYHNLEDVAEVWRQAFRLFASRRAA